MALKLIQGKQITVNLTGSFTGSFTGDGSGLTNLPAQSINTGSFVTTSSFNAFTSSYNTGSFTGSFTGSLFGTASWAINAISSSFAISASQAISSSFAISASWAPSIAGGSTTQIQFNSGSRLQGTGSFTFDYLNQSLQQGLAVTASGIYSHAEGNNTIAIGNYSHAEGTQTKTGIQTAFEKGNIVNGLITLNSNVSSFFTPGGYLYVFDTNINTKTSYLIDTVTFNGSSTLIQLVDTTLNVTSGVIGDITYLLNNGGTFGSTSTIPGIYSHTEGNSTKAVGDYSHAEGQTTTALGNYSHTEGGNTQAVGTYSHAEGASTQAIGVGSHAEGRLTQAIGIYAHAEGLETVALGNYQHVQGQYNIPLGTSSSFIHGNGTSNENRSNLIYAHDSIVEITGSLDVTGGIIGNLTGTATNATNADNAANATQAVSASYALTASFAISSSRSISSSFATTASYALNGGVTQIIAGTNVTITNGGSGSVTINSTASGGSINTGSFATTGSNTFIGNQVITGSLNVTQGITGSLFGTSSWSNNSITASYALNGGVTQLLAGPNVTLSPTNGLGQVTVSALSSGGGFNTATGSYGSFYSTQTQTNVAGTARSMSLNTTDITNGVLVSGSTDPFNTYIKTENAGVYDIQFSAQVDKTDSGTDEIWIWLRKNGTNLTDTATSVQLTGNGAHYVAAWNFFVNAAANDYFQLMWYSPDANVRLHAESAFGVVPGIPSLIVTANRVDQFLSNTGSFSGSFTGGFTGSLFGTSSWATNALTASYVQNAQSASYVLQAVSSSFAATASLAPDYVLTSATSSMLQPYVLTSSTSSFVAPDILLQDITINMPNNGAATTNNVVGTALTIGGTPGIRTITDTNLFTRTTRIALETTAVAANVFTFRQVVGYFSINTGFKASFKFGASTGATNTNVRYSIGVFVANFIVTNVDPTTFINCAAFARIDGSTNWQFIHNDATGTATSIDLGALFPANTVSTDMYYATIETVSGNIKYTLKRLNTGDTVTGTVSTNLIAASTLLTMSAGCSNNANSAICALDFGGMQLIKFT